MRRYPLIAIALATLLTAGAIAGCGEETKSTPDTDIGLSKTSVFDTPAPDSTRANLSEPGDRPGVPGESSVHPSPIPHGIADFLPITLADNQCIGCHAVEEKEPGEPTPIPPSHYTDLRHAPGEAGDEIAGARYNCLGCHVSPGENEPLVGNTAGE
jgi:cytochrome c-type protein NapB